MFLKSISSILIFNLQALNWELDFQRFFQENDYYKNAFEQFFVPLKRMFGARIVHDTYVHQVFLALNMTL